ncbi:hypothetical protein ES702_07203 [subsurface metagenome]
MAFNDIFPAGCNVQEALAIIKKRLLGSILGKNPSHAKFMRDCYYEMLFRKFKVLFPNGNHGFSEGSFDIFEQTIRDFTPEVILEELKKYPDLMEIAKTYTLKMRQKKEVNYGKIDY